VSISLLGYHENLGDNFRININPSYATRHNLSHSLPNDEADNGRIEVNNQAYNGTQPNNNVVERNPAYAGSDIV